MDFFTTEAISANREITPDNFLLCREVPIARTGAMKYLPTEIIGSKAGSDGFVYVSRSDDQVFDEDSMASINGKPIVIFHNPVSPENWKALSVGTVMNPRRGEGADGDLLIADLLIMDADAIRKVQEADEMPVSAGYDATYEQGEPGQGTQSNIRYNHLALLPNSEGRCGNRCSIGDSAANIDGDAKSSMKKSWKTQLVTAFKKFMDEAPEDLPEDETTDEAPADSQPDEKKEDAPAETQDEAPTLESLCARIDALESKLAELTTDEAPADDKKEDEPQPAADEQPAEEEKKDEPVQTSDSAALVVAAQDAFMRAEILAPGIQMPVHDAKAEPKTFQDSLCALKRKALTAAYNDSKTRDAVAPLVAGIDVNKLTCDALHATFVGASELVKQKNNAVVTYRDAATQLSNSIADMNRRNKDFWTRQ